MLVYQRVVVMKKTNKQVTYGLMGIQHLNIVMGYNMI